MVTQVPEQTRVILRINEVETDTQIAHCEDKTGGVFKAKFGDNHGVLIVPKAGELWNATRVGYIWKLISRIDTTAGLQPGDGVIDLDGIFKLYSTGMEINDVPVGIAARDVFYPDGTVSSFVLSAVPVNPDFTVEVFQNGLLCPPTGYTISNTTITFGLTPGAGVMVISYQRAAALVIADAARAVGIAVISATEVFTP